MRLIIFIIGIAIAGAINPEYMDVEGNESSMVGLMIIMIYAVILDMVKKQ